MPTWGAVLKEFQDSARQRGQLGPDTDGIRLKYIKRLRELTGRAIIVYASGWLKNRPEPNVSFSVEGADVHALMEVCHGVEERSLDLIIHSPGGSPDAAEQMLNYLRTQFDHIRAIVPLQAKSAATMLALGCDEIVMGMHSELGPIDPQIPMPIPGGARYAPAHAILRDFKRAKQEVAEDVNRLAAWTPILHSYAGGLLEFCTQQIKLSQEIVASWLSRYMLTHADAGIAEGDRQQVAYQIAQHFGSEESYDPCRTHGRPIRIEELEQIRGLTIRRLEDDNGLQDAVLSLYHALDLSFNGPVVKIVENHLGARYAIVQQQVQVQLMPAPPNGAQQPTPIQPKPNGAQISHPQVPQRAKHKRK